MIFYDFLFRSEKIYPCNSYSFNLFFINFAFKTHHFMEHINLDGLGVALATPFNEDLSIDYEALLRLIEHVIKGGCDYIVVLGTTSETPTLSLDEKILLSEFIRVNVNGRVPLVIGIGGNNTRKVCESMRDRDLAGYSAILSVTPYYNKPNQRGLLEHYSVLAENSPLPLILYNVPGRTGVNLSAETTLKLARKFENIIAIKEASGKIEQCKEIIAGAPAGFSLISGDDGTTCDIMSIGGKGVISVLANAFPAPLKALLEVCNKADWTKARQTQDSLKEIISPLFEEGNPVGIKATLAELGLIKNVLRLPLVPASPGLCKKIKVAAERIASVND